LEERYRGRAIRGFADVKKKEGGGGGKEVPPVHQQPLDTGGAKGMAHEYGKMAFVSFFWKGEGGGQGRGGGTDQNGEILSS